MKLGSFMDIVSVHYKDIVSLFKSRHNIIEFDEDLFGDAFVKCAEKFGNNIIDYDTVIKYFWVVYVNTTKSNFINKAKHQITSIDDIDDIDDIDVVGDIYEEDMVIYDVIMDSIAKEFGENDMQMYRLYKYHNWNEDELKTIGINLNKNTIKEIHKFVKSYSKQLKRSQ